MEDECNDCSMLVSNDSSWFFECCRRLFCDDCALNISTDRCCECRTRICEACESICDVCNESHCHVCFEGDICIPCFEILKVYFRDIHIIIKEYF